MYDKKWMKSKEDKPIDTIEDALMVIVANLMCAGGCNKCAMHMYDHSDSKCGTTKDKAMRFLCEACGAEYDKLQESSKRVQLVYEQLFVKGVKISAKAEPETACKGTCEHCFSSEMHVSGIRWCKSFGNFVHDNGYCYKYAGPDKTE